MRVLCVWGVVCLIWSTSWIAVEIGLQDLPPLSFAGFRFAVASTILLGVCILRRVPLPHARRDWLLIAGTGVLFFTINYSLIFWGNNIFPPVSPPCCKR